MQPGVLVGARATRPAKWAAALFALALLATAALPAQGRKGKVHGPARAAAASSHRAAARARTHSAGRPTKGRHTASSSRRPGAGASAARARKPAAQIGRRSNPKSRGRAAAKPRKIYVPRALLPAKKRAANNKLASLKHQIHAKKQALHATRAKQQQLSVRIHDNETHLQSAQDRLRGTKARLSQAQGDLAASERRLADAQRCLASHMTLLRGRLVDVYKHGSASYAVAMLQADDMWDLTSRGVLLRRVVRHDANLLQSIKVEKAEIASETARLRTRRNEVARLRVAQQQQVQEVSEQLSEQREIHQGLARDAARIEAALSELEQNSREVEAMLRAFEAQPDIVRRIPKPWTGGFLRPVPGRVSSGFGMRYHPILHVTKLHTGVDLAAAYGSPIHAAGDGVVVHAGWWGGYGNCIVIAHGNGRSTLYGHCSSLSVSDGQHVQRGQVIGHVGSTGFSTGPHLHFEVRKNGVPVNPLGQ